MKLSNLALAAFAAFFVLASPATAEKICRSMVTGTDSLPNPSRMIAKFDARASWRIEVTTQHSAKFANWSNANGHSYNCRKRTNNIGVNYWLCRASARPCAHR